MKTSATNIPARIRQEAAILCLLAFLSALPLSQPALAQEAKRPLTHQDYDSWRSIQAPQFRATENSSPTRIWPRTVTARS